MDNTNTAAATKVLPTTTKAVMAELEAYSSAHLRLNDHAKADYLLGLCATKLAEANREIIALKLQRARKRVGSY